MPKGIVTPKRPRATGNGKVGEKLMLVCGHEARSRQPTVTYPVSKGYRAPLYECADGCGLQRRRYGR